MNLLKLFMKLKKYRHILSFGSNLGDREYNCRVGLEKLLKHCALIRKSRSITTLPLISVCYETKNHQDYLNFIVEIACDYSPFEFYTGKIQMIEQEIGHSREAKWLPRYLDIDILLSSYNTNFDFSACQKICVKSENFCVPHSEIFKRDFLLNLLEGDFKILLNR